MRISDWSSDVCSADLVRRRRRAPPRRTRRRPHRRAQLQPRRHAQGAHRPVLGMKRGATAVIAAALVFTQAAAAPGDAMRNPLSVARSEDHTSELQSLMRISYAVFCLKKKKYTTTTQGMTPN